MGRFAATAISITTPDSKIRINMTLIKNETQHNVILLCTIFILVLGVAFFVVKLNVILPTVVTLGVVIPSVGAPFFT